VKPIAIPLVAGAALLVLPLFASEYIVVLALRAVMYSLIVMSFSLLAGQLGLISLLQSTFAGIAGYGVAILSTGYGWSAGPAAMAGLLLAVASAAVVGVVSLKASGVGFMMLTIALGQMVWALSFQWIDLTRGMDGIVSIPAPEIAGFDLRDPRAMYVVTALAVTLCFWSAHVLMRSRLGLLMRGIQDNAPRMRALGHPILRARLAAFLIASLYAGIGGILLTWETRVITPVTLDLSRAVWVLTAAVIGGTTSLGGSVIGVLVMVTLEAVLSQYTDRHVLAFGLILALAILLLPNGVSAVVSNLWAKHRGRSRGASATKLAR
jgi:branched-chain amino acid transport system permease protein